MLRLENYESPRDATLVSCSALDPFNSTFPLAGSNTKLSFLGLVEGFYNVGLFSPSLPHLKLDAGNRTLLGLYDLGVFVFPLLGFKSCSFQNEKYL